VNKLRISWLKPVGPWHDVHVKGDRRPGAAGVGFASSGSGG